MCYFISYSWRRKLHLPRGTEGWRGKKRWYTQGKDGLYLARARRPQAPSPAAIVAFLRLHKVGTTNAARSLIDLSLISAEVLFSKLSMSQLTVSFFFFFFKVIFTAKNVTIQKWLNKIHITIYKHIIRRQNTIEFWLGKLGPIGFYIEKEDQMFTVLTAFLLLEPEVRLI